ncbi:GNAT family N-acetyltransferase [Leptothoe spongobia]|uniref:GNAT family N-acetyltransferase n=1 Tax=Leptothoe spongobia TAU-MAC 1115 TaxID=1967444 RepID=A0A947GKB6_9CYAN|nr:GNAT family N-acetyltransferase [Leptothoe spongobia]MBT9316212.1 GNAT family N-acetyltransferase [Leptothoe spongobia TAU-MAC 1115]
MSLADLARIRVMPEADIPNLKSFVDQTVGDDYFYESTYSVVNPIPVVVAEHQQKLVGVAAVYHNSLHPYWVKILVAVAEDARRQGLGRKLHEAALQARPLQQHHLGVEGDYDFGNEAAEGFLKSLGYQLRLDCHCFELSLEGFNFSHELVPPSQVTSNSLKIISLKDLFLTPTKQQEVFDFLVSRYTEEHFWSPPHPKDHPEWQKVISNKGILPELSFALLANGQVVGATTAGVTGDDTLDMIWAYVSRQYSTDEAILLLKCLLAHQFKAALDRGLSKAEGEIDTTDTVYCSLLNWLPICNDKVWRILQAPRTLLNHSDAAD